MDFDGILFFPVTPFDAAGRVDDDLLREHVATTLAHAPGGVFPACGTGEFHALSADRGGARSCASRPRPSPAGAGRRGHRRSARARDRGRARRPPTPVPTRCSCCRRTWSAGRRRDSSPTSRRSPRHPLCPSSSTTAAPRSTRSTSVRPARRATRRSSASRTASATSGLAQQIVRAVAETGRDDFAFFNGLLTAELTQGAYRGIGIPLYSSAAFAMVPEIANAYYRAYVDGDEVRRVALLDGLLRAARARCATRRPASASRSSRPGCGSAGCRSAACAHRWSTRGPATSRRPSSPGPRAGRPLLSAPAVDRSSAPVIRVCPPALRAADAAAGGGCAGRRDRDGAPTATAARGFSWTPQIGAEAVHALLEHDIAPAASGLPPTPRPCGTRCGSTSTRPAAGDSRRSRSPGSISRCGMPRPAGPVPPSTLLGRRQDSARYGSGVNLHYPLDELLAQVERWIDAGPTPSRSRSASPTSPKTSSGSRRCAVLGPDRELMIDANQRWDLDHAQAVDALSAFAPAWIEEPLRADDLAGHAELRRIHVPIAVGENLHTVYRFAEFLDAGAAQIVQPNIVRVGGITPFRRIAALARTTAPGDAPPAARALRTARAHAGRGHDGRRRRGRRLRPARRPRRTLTGRFRTAG